jgi:hypothetical protein
MNISAWSLATTQLEEALSSMFTPLHPISYAVWCCRARATLSRGRPDAVANEVTAF